MALVLRLQTFLEKENDYRRFLEKENYKYYKYKLASAYFFYNDKKDKKNYFF